MSERDRTCEDRIDANLEHRLADLRRILNGEIDDEDESEDLAEYGLCFDYVGAETYNDQKEAFFRYQLSWGGPSDEMRFFVNPDLSCHRIEYWFLDWFDGAHRALADEAEKLLLRVWRWFIDTESARHAFDNRVQ